MDANNELAKIAELLKDAEKWRMHLSFDGDSATRGKHDIVKKEFVLNMTFSATQLQNVANEIATRVSKLHAELS